MSVDDEEAAVRAFLQGVILRRMRMGGIKGPLPNLERAEVWDLMKAVAALGYNIDLVVRSGSGRVTADWQETDT